MEWTWVKFACCSILPNIHILRHNCEASNILSRTSSGNLAVCRASFMSNPYRTSKLGSVTWFHHSFCRGRVGRNCRCTNASPTTAPVSHHSSYWIFSISNYFVSGQKSGNLFNESESLIKSLMHCYVLIFNKSPPIQLLHHSSSLSTSMRKVPSHSASWNVLWCRPPLVGS